MTLPDSINEIPNFAVTKDFNRWADYVELRCLKSTDQEISLSDVLGFFRANDLVDDTLGRNDHSESSDKNYQRMKDIFSLFEYREIELGNNYPFSYDKENFVLSTKTMDAQHELYYFLLSASNVAFFNRQILQRLTHTFEDLCRDILEIISPTNAVTELFGTSRANQGRYTGNLGSRIKAVAQEINCKAAPNIDSDPKFSAPAGDAGLDIISYLKIDDQPFIPTAFAQCACSCVEWSNKQNSISYEKWRGRLLFLAPICQYTFVPFFLRKNNGDWENLDDIQSCIIDRQRIYRVLCSKQDIADTITAKIKPILQEATN